MKIQKKNWRGSGGRGRGEGSGWGGGQGGCERRIEVFVKIKKMGGSGEGGWVGGGLGLGGRVGGGGQGGCE